MSAIVCRVPPASLRLGFDLSCAATPRPTGVGLAAACLCRALRDAQEPLGLDVRPLVRWSRWRKRAHADALLGAPTALFDSRLSLLLGRGLDVVHGPDARLPVYAGGAALVATVHDLSARRPGNAEERFRRTREGHWADVAARADLVVTYTAAVRSEVAAGLGVPIARIAVVPLATPPGLERPGDEEAAAVARRVVGERPYVLALGERSWRKNTAGAVRALAAAGPALAGHALLLVGPAGHGHEEVDKAIADVGLAGRVVVAEYLPRRDVAALLSRAAALLFPSRYEGFGMPVLEAFEAGVPVVASRDPSVLEVAGGCALHADAEDMDGLGRALERVVSDARLRDDLVTRGRARARGFTWAGAARRLSGVYNAARARAAAPDDIELAALAASSASARLRA